MASIIPDKHLFIVTSALNPDMGVINREDRFQQTLNGLLTLRKSVPDSLILLTDGSPNMIEEDKIRELSKYVNMVAVFSGDNDIKQFASTGRKSEAENVLMLKTILLLKNDHQLMRMMHSVKRIYKLSARTDIIENFTVEDHDHYGKYVFKKRIPTWITDNRKEFATDLLITRLFSICPSLLDDYLSIAYNNINLVSKTGVDTEHAHFFNINKKYLVELDRIYCQGVMAGTGQTEIY